MKKILFLAIFIIITTPSVTYAAWWNPFSWNLFSQHSIKSEVIKPIATSTQALNNTDIASQNITNLKDENTYPKDISKKRAERKENQQNISTQSPKIIQNQGSKGQIDCNELENIFVDNYIPKINNLFVAKRKEEGADVTRLKNQEIDTLSNAGKITTSESDAIFDKYLSYWQRRLIRLEQERKDYVKNTYQKILTDIAPHCKNTLTIKDLKEATDINFVQQSTIQKAPANTQYSNYQYNLTTNSSINKQESAKGTILPSINTSTFLPPHTTYSSFNIAPVAGAGSYYIDSFGNVKYNGDGISGALRTDSLGNLYYEDSSGYSATIKTDPIGGIRYNGNDGTSGTLKTDSLGTVQYQSSDGVSGTIKTDLFGNTHYYNNDGGTLTCSEGFMGVINCH